MYINDKSTVFYCDEDNCIPLAEVWSKIGLPGYMDTSVMVINPMIGFEVFKNNVKNV